MKCATRGTWEGRPLHVAVARTAGSAAPNLTAWGSWATYDVADVASLALAESLTEQPECQVLVLAPHRLAAKARILASTVGAVHPHRAVHVEDSDASGLALTRALELMRDIEGMPNEIHSRLMATLEEMVWGAYLPSVTRLSAPPPTMRQHLHSWWPWRQGFLAVGGVSGWVERLPLKPGAVPQSVTQGPRRRGRPSLGLTGVADGEMPEVAIAALVELGAAGRPERRTRVSDMEREWGSARAVEFVLSLASAADPARPQAQCSTCSSNVWAATCPFCRTSDLAAPRSGGARL